MLFWTAHEVSGIGKNVYSDGMKEFQVNVSNILDLKSKKAPGKLYFKTYMKNLVRIWVIANFGPIFETRVGSDGLSWSLSDKAFC